MQQVSFVKTSRHRLACLMCESIKGTDSSVTWISAIEGLEDHNRKEASQNQHCIHVGVCHDLPMQIQQHAGDPHGSLELLW